MEVSSRIRSPKMEVVDAAVASTRSSTSEIATAGSQPQPQQQQQQQAVVDSKLKNEFESAVLWDCSSHRTRRVTNSHDSDISEGDMSDGDCDDSMGNYSFASALQQEQHPTTTTTNTTTQPEPQIQIRDHVEDDDTRNQTPPQNHGHDHHHETKNPKSRLSMQFAAKLPSFSDSFRKLKKITKRNIPSQQSQKKKKKSKKKQKKRRASSSCVDAPSAVVTCRELSSTSTHLSKRNFPKGGNRYGTDVRHRQSSSGGSRKTQRSSEIRNIMVKRIISIVPTSISHTPLAIFLRSVLPSRQERPIKQQQQHHHPSKESIALIAAETATAETATDTSSDKTRKVQFDLSQNTAHNGPSTFVVDDEVKSDLWWSKEVLQSQRMSDFMSCHDDTTFSSYLLRSYELIQLNNTELFPPDGSLEFERPGADIDSKWMKAVLIDVTVGAHRGHRGLEGFWPLTRQRRRNCIQAVVKTTTLFSNNYNNNGENNNDRNGEEEDEERTLLLRRSDYMKAHCCAVARLWGLVDAAVTGHDEVLGLKESRITL